MGFLLTEPQRAFRAILIAVARGAWPKLERPDDTISYRELGEAASSKGLVSFYPMLTPPFRGMGAELGVVSTYEVAFGRPLLSALVIQEASGQPGPGFVDLARRLGVQVGADHESYVRTEQSLVRDFWRDQDPTRVIDAATSVLIDRLDQIRKDLRRIQ